MSTTSEPPPSTRLDSPTVRRAVLFAVLAGLLVLAYVLRGVLVPLLLAFLLAYALDPFVDWLEARKVPRGLAAPIVMLAIASLLVLVLVFAIPMFMDELRGQPRICRRSSLGWRFASSRGSGRTSTSSRRTP